jgi:hypothetical protein
MTSTRPSFTAICEGNIWMVTALTGDARAWVEENVPTEHWQWLGRGFSVDQHCIENLVNRIADAGFTVKVER